MATVAQHVIAALEISGVTRVYGLPGDSLNGFTDAIRRSDVISWEHVRHEETAAFAAAGRVSSANEPTQINVTAPNDFLNLMPGYSFRLLRSRFPPAPAFLRFLAVQSLS